MKRIVLFVVTNLAVVAVLTIVLSLLGIDRWMTSQGINYRMLLGFSLVVGFGGRFFSLAISKWMARHAYGIRVIQQPGSEAESWLLNQIQGMARSAGVTMPEVGVYDSP